MTIVLGIHNIRVALCFYCTGGRDSCWTTQSSVQGMWLLEAHPAYVHCLLFVRVCIQIYSIYIVLEGMSYDHYSLGISLDQETDTPTHILLYTYTCVYWRSVYYVLYFTGGGEWTSFKCWNWTRDHCNSTATCCTYKGIYLHTHPCTVIYTPSPVYEAGTQCIPIYFVYKSVLISVAIVK